MEQPACDVCRRPRVACVCDRIVSFPTERRVLILQHPQEQDALLGSAQILVASLPKAKLVIGLSWRNLGHALGEEDVDARKWAVLFPDREAEGNQLTSRRGTPLDPKNLEGIIVLDGTWSRAKSLWWRNPWLNKLNRMSLTPKNPSIYGRLRAEPRREYVSTLESVAAALTTCGESPEIEAGLSRVFRTLMQRVRDANLAPEERRLPKRTRPPRKPPAAEAPPPEKK
ncbi:MAG: DTW domain-containing protein [Polyangiaceae bacterium]|nr:DTW domain-containing protein [Polyangiaceae bacterium]